MQTLINLLAFVRVMDAGSFAEAARRAGTTTSAMSKAVSRFERAHAVKLLHRTTHALSATAEGEHLLEGARDLLRDAERLEASLAAASGRGSVGRVRDQRARSLRAGLPAPHAAPAVARPPRDRRRDQLR